MDNNQSNNFSEENATPKQPTTPPKQPKKGFGMKQLAIVAVVAAVVGGGVGGGVAYGIMAQSGNTSSVDQAVSSGKSGTTKVSNVSVNQSSASSTAFSKVEKAVVSVVNMQKTQSTSSGLDSFGDLFGDSGDSGSDSSSSSSSSGSTLEDASEGSGVIYQKKDGKAYIVTNNHVVEGSDALEVILADGTKVSAKLVGTDETSDLAVLSINGAKVSTVASFGNSSAIKAGQTVLAIGSPLGSDYATSVTRGIISATSRTVDVSDETTGQVTGQANVIQTDAAINSGNSGGPLINLSGQVIGINSMKLSGTSNSNATIEGMGFAIPSNEVVSIINQLVANGKVVRPALGIEARNLASVSASQQSSLLKVPSSVTGGVVVAGFTSTSIAKKAGLKKYDVIVAVDGTSVDSVATLHTALYKHDIGDTVSVTYYRGSSKKTVKVKLTQTTEQLDSSSSSTK